LGDEPPPFLPPCSAFYVPVFPPPSLSDFFGFWGSSTLGGVGRGLLTLVAPRFEPFPFFPPRLCRSLYCRFFCLDCEVTCSVMQYVPFFSFFYSCLPPFFFFRPFFFPGMFLRFQPPRPQILPLLSPHPSVHTCLFSVGSFLGKIFLLKLLEVTSRLFVPQPPVAGFFCFFFPSWRSSFSLSPSFSVSQAFGWPFYSLTLLCSSSLLLVTPPPPPCLWRVLIFDTQGSSPHAGPFDPCRLLSPLYHPKKKSGVLSHLSA